MKAILFDVGGVFLSEERCFDVSAVTVAEPLSGPDFLNCDIDIHLDGNLTENDINKARRNVFNNDRILNQLRSLGLNSNWDMLFIVFSIHLTDKAKQLKPSLRDQLLDELLFTKGTLKEIARGLTDKTISYSLPYDAMTSFRNGKGAICEDLEIYVRNQLELNNTSLFKLKSALWTLAEDIYQEWYLGKALFNQVEYKKDIQGFKKGFIYDEVILKPIEEIQLLLQNPIKAGYQTAIVTGRPRTETTIPFQSLGLKSYPKDEHIVTASGVLLTEKQFPQYQSLGKPNPFSYIATLNGNYNDQYERYATKQEDIVNKDEAYIVGDSLADLLSAKRIGATLIGILTGLKGRAAHSELVANGADHVVEDITRIRKTLL